MHHRGDTAVQSRHDLEYSPEMSRRPKLVLIPDHRGRDFSQPTCDQGSVTACAFLQCCYQHCDSPVTVTDPRSLSLWPLASGDRDLGSALAGLHLASR